MTIAATNTIFLVDDDHVVRESVQNLLRSVGHIVEGFPSVEDCLERLQMESPAVLVLDVRLPGVSGLEFQRRLRSADDRIPVIFVSGYGDIPITVQAMKDGALDFLTKPFRDQAFLDAVQQALEVSEVYRVEMRGLAQVQGAYESLSQRERQIMGLVIQGKTNKRIGASIGISEVTVKVHRAHMMRKMNACNLADLVRMGDRLGLPSPGPFG
jgi:FixJ family two-component response regulator